MKRMRLWCGIGVGTAAVLLFGGCGGAAIEGRWTEPIPGMEGRQGFVLQADGSAASVGMQTLRYDRWERRGDRLILQGRSLGNGQTIRFSDTLTIRTLTADRLVLRRDDGAELSFDRE